MVDGAESIPRRGSRAGGVKKLLKSSLVRNTGWQLMGQGAGYGLRVVYFIVIARLLGVVQYGLVVSAFSLVNVVAQYSRVGMGMVLLRYVSGNLARFAVYWGNVLLVTAMVGGVLVVVLRLAAPSLLDPASARVVALMAVAVCLLEQVTISATQAFQAFQEMKTAAVLDQLTPMFRTFAAIGMLAAMHHATARQWAVAQMLVSAAATAVALSIVTVKLGLPKFRPGLAWTHSGEGIEYSFASSTTNAYNDLDKTMLSHYGRSAENGIYGLAYRVIEMGSVPITAIQLAAVPRLFQLAESGNREPVMLGRKLLRHGLLVSSATAAGMFAAAPLIPLLVGRGFSEATSALRWLCLIPVFRSVHGITGCVLTSVGLQRYRTLTQFSVVVLNFGLNVWLIPRYGWHGAAWSSLATDGTLGLLNWTILKVKSVKIESSEHVPVLTPQAECAN
jgi:O-antigen/teichoic acid export membrane protein